MNITVKVNDNITIECVCFIEGDQWAVGAGEFGRMPYALGPTIATATNRYISKINNESPPKPAMPITPPQTIQLGRPQDLTNNSAPRD